MARRTRAMVIATHPRLVEYGGRLVDLLTIAGLAAGLRERVGERA